jgi:hypothetical protein
LRAIPSYKRRCGDFGYAIASAGHNIKFTMSCNRWDCKTCGLEKTSRWMGRIDSGLPGVILYTISRKNQNPELSIWIRNNIEKRKKYFSVHLTHRALVFSNARFKGAKARNKKKFLRAIRKLMEVVITGREQGQSQRII